MVETLRGRSHRKSPVRHCRTWAAGAVTERAMLILRRGAGREDRGRPAPHEPTAAVAHDDRRAGPERHSPPARDRERPGESAAIGGGVPPALRARPRALARLHAPRAAARRVGPPRRMERTVDSHAQRLRASSPAPTSRSSSRCGASYTGFSRPLASARGSGSNRAVASETYGRAPATGRLRS